jgi:hypothetical protein
MKQNDLSLNTVGKKFYKNTHVKTRTEKFTLQISFFNLSIDFDTRVIKLFLC